MTGQQNEIVRNPKIEQRFKTSGKTFLSKSGKLTMELCSAYEERFHPTGWHDWHQNTPKLYAAYESLCGVCAQTTTTFDEFWNDKFAAALLKLFEPEETKRLREICAVVFDSPYAHNTYRPSYRSKRAGDYAENFFAAIIHAISFICYDISTAQAIRKGRADICGSERIAVAIRGSEKDVCALVKEAILGESSEVKLSYTVIAAVIKSGVPEYVELLGKLLLAAKGQEGVRQAILENADCGSAQTHLHFIGLVTRHKLARFSSVIRAFGTWTGLAYDNAKPAVIDKCIKLAHLHLSEEAKLETGLQSADVLEIYMVLWASACRDIHSASLSAVKLLDAPEKYRRLVGWYFLHSTVHEQVQYEIAMRYIDLRDPEELAWVCRCLYTNSNAVRHYRWANEGRKDAYPDAVFPESAELRGVHFGKLCAAFEFIGNKKTTFNGSVFPWMSVQLDGISAAKCLLGIAGYDCDPAMLQKLAQYLPQMNSDVRMAYYMNLLDPGVPAQRGVLLAGLSDKSVHIKEDIVKLLADETLTATDIEHLINTLTTTSSGLRGAVMSLLGQQPETLIRPGLTALLDSSNSKQLLAGVELLDVFGEKNPALREEFSAKIAQLQSRDNLPKDIAVILARFGPDEPADDYTPENGFGLFDPISSDFDKNAWADKRPKVIIYSKSELAKLLSVDDDELRKITAPIVDVIVGNKGLECKVQGYDGAKHKVLLGDNPYELPRLPGIDRNSATGSIYECYLADEIMAAIDAAGASPITIAKILCLSRYGEFGYGCSFSSAAKKIFAGLPFDKTLDLSKYAGEYSGMVYSILESVLPERQDGVFDFAMSVWVSLVQLIPDAELMTAYQTRNKDTYYYAPDQQIDCMLDINIINEWRDIAFQVRQTDEHRKAFLSESWYEYLRTDRKRERDGCIFCAKEFGLLGDDALYHELLTGPRAGGHIRDLTASVHWANAQQKHILEKHPFVLEYLDKAVDRIVTVEQRRGELPTPLTPVAAQIGYFKGGAKHFSALLAALGKDSFERGYYYGGSGRTKKCTLSALLKNCYPLSSDTPDEFKAAVASSTIPEKRLLQAVMYAPQWADLAEKATGITGLASAVWLFHAHINESFSAEKETKVARYSPVSHRQFADGTFDKDWFLDTYATVGQKVFDELYKNAKYITSSNSAHRRSQLYTDAVLGRLDKAATQAEIADKRNQEKLRAYGLIPLDEKNPGDALARYEFIQKFAKESKQFGGQRKASEGKAVTIALQNLALTTGFGDADRMSWYLESEKMDALRHLMQPQSIDGTDVWLEIADDGTTFMGVSKGGKALGSLPKALAKNETALVIQAAVKDLRDQKKRARLGFEMAMVSRTVFSTKEVLRLLGHPVLRGMVQSLVFVSGDKLGFPALAGDHVSLAAPDGTQAPLSQENGLIIAHPHDMLECKCWSEYQRHLYANQITQPFKQVFREYYPLTEDERAEVNLSRRYAGHQVQPQKTVALLKTRGWTADYYEGLQRVYHKENLIAKMYAMADWFSPSDVEAPTLEVIRFYSRDKGEPLAFESVPPVIFSEVMRDIDLVVSVAHVGGVDPQASHSTVEMRVAIARELLALLSVGNVTFQAAHAQIRGSMGEYSIHMGSGVVHQSGVGMLAVLPVHSQARGRIFLPFADDDPRTAEIMSKILLLADDKKIKDPAILRQIETK